MQKSLKNLLNLTRFNPITRNFPFPPLLSSFKYQFSNIIDPKNPLLLNQAFNNENKNEELKAQAVKALQETTQEEEQHFSLEDKTFTAKIGQHTLTYTSNTIKL